jgi:hypothetical protein
VGREGTGWAARWHCSNGASSQTATLPVRAAQRSTMLISRLSHRVDRGAAIASQTLSRERTGGW